MVTRERVEGLTAGLPRPAHALAFGEGTDLLVPTKLGLGRSERRAHAIDACVEVVRF